jgi:hypothetical protein
MQKYLLAAIFVVALAGPAFAEQFYVAFDPASHKCSMMHSQPVLPMKEHGLLCHEGRGKQGHGLDEGMHRRLVAAHFENNRPAVSAGLFVAAVALAASLRRC